MCERGLELVFTGHQWRKGEFHYCVLVICMCALLRILRQIGRDLFMQSATEACISRAFLIQIELLKRGKKCSLFTMNKVHNER